MAAYYLNEQALETVMKAHGLTSYARLAAALGLPRTTVWRIATGRTPVTAELMAATRQAFPEIDPDYLYRLA